MGIVRNIPTLKSYSGEFDGVGEYSSNFKKDRDKLQENVNAQHQKELNASFKNNIIEAELKEALIDRLSERAYKEGSEQAFASRLCETFINSLVVDEYFIKENRETIENYFYEKLKESANGDIYQFMCMIEENSEYLEELVEACKKRGAKASKNVSEGCKKKVKEGCDKDDDCDDLDDDDDDLDDIDDDLDLNEGCKGKKKVTEACGGKKKIKEGCNSKKKDEIELDEIFDNEMEKIKSEACKSQEETDIADKEVSEIVKDKVVNVIKTEEENNKKKQELIDDITASNNDLQENVTLFKNDHVEHHSLFNSIMINGYKRCIGAIKEGTDIGSYGTLSEAGEVQVNMDFIMFDTILEYTRLELLNTIKVTNLNAIKLREMAYNYAYVLK